MRAIAGILEGDPGARPDPALLDGIREALGLRCHAAGALWCEGPLALAHARLEAGALPADRGTVFAEHPLGVAVLDGRLDDRPRLVAELRGRGFLQDGEASDAELLLQAYAAWGVECCANLLGEFAFALWDWARRRLFLGRDRFGVRPLFYAMNAGTFAFSGELQALFRVPWTRGAPEVPALLDFLLFSHFPDPAATGYARVRQLPAAHAMTVEGGRVSTWRYWTPAPLDLPRRLKPRDAVTGFRDVLAAAVADRVREPEVGILLSGGLDSTAVAALAAEAGRGAGLRLRGYTVTCDRLHPGDEEGRLARLAAATLGFETHGHPADEARPFADWEACASPFLPPVYSPFYANHRELLLRVASDGCRVLLSGEGGDPSLLAPGSHCRALFERGQWGRLLGELLGALRARGSLRQLGLKGLRPGADFQPKHRPAFPVWLRPEVVRRHGLRERWESVYAFPTDPVTRQEAAAEDLGSAGYYGASIRHDMGVWTPLEVRYPFFDARVVGFLLALPQCLAVDKWVLRQALSGALPEAILRRPKTPFAFDRIRAWLEGARNPADRAWPFEMLLEYVDPDHHSLAVERYAGPLRSPYPWDGLSLMTPVALEGWLRNARREGLLVS